MLFLYSRFKGSWWENYTPQKRLKILQALEKRLAKKQGRPVLEVVVHDSPDWNCLGMFEVKGNSELLYINRTLLEKHEYRFFALETIIHEGRHAYQYFIINKPKISFFNFKAKQWKKNWQGYYSADENKTIYTMQAVERDAQKYTIKLLKKLSYKYKNEKAFIATFKANLDRFENGELDAKKEFGLFYKQKINKKISQKSNRY